MRGTAAGILATGADNYTGAGNSAVEGAGIPVAAGRTAARTVRDRSYLCRRGNRIARSGR